MSEQFPDGFMWGAATAAHQVEGGLENDWTRWEEQHAEDRAVNAHERIPGRQRFFAGTVDPDVAFPAATDPENYRSGVAVDHLNRYEEDFDLAAEMGHTAHRFSIAWSRIQPERGVIDHDALDHYRDVIAALRERGIEPVVTAWHFTLPQWFVDMGGWMHHAAPDLFEEYVDILANELDVTYWLTMNEPQVYAAGAYLGDRPPEGTSPWGYVKTLRHMVTAHTAAYRTIHATRPEAHVGIAKNNGVHRPYNNRWYNRALVGVADWWWNDMLLDQVQSELDFIGLNHYVCNTLDRGWNRTAAERTSDMGWALKPAAMQAALTELQKYDLPIMITENGLADARDTHREWYIKNVLRAVHAAIADGADVRGYMHWSLLDNFEWDEGFWPRFGLIAVDPDTLEREVRPSGWAYADIIRRNAVSDSS